MTTIRISDNDLDRFYSQNPNFDILKFNLSDRAALSQLDWENLDRETVLEGVVQNKLTLCRKSKSVKSLCGKGFSN